MLVLLSTCVSLLQAQPSPITSTKTELLIGDICRLKGQEENTLMGLGIVVGLKASGDGESGPTLRALARNMQLLGGQVGVDPKGLLQTKELKDAKNVAVVFVTATIPNRGAQQGDRLDCTISAISAKSLEGGTLLSTPLLGPRVDKPTVYALAQGPIVIQDLKIPTSAKISRGCKMEATILNEFTNGDLMTLVLDPGHSSFTAAQYIENVINERTAMASAGNANAKPLAQDRVARAVDQMHVEVKIPAHYKDQPVNWASLILELPLSNLQPQKRVVIQERSGVIIIGEDVSIAPVAISHKNLSISTKGKGSFKGVDSASGADPQNRPKLQHLVDSLNLLAVPNEDVIAIIKALKHQGNLYGELVIE